MIGQERTLVVAVFVWPKTDFRGYVDRLEFDVNL